MQTTGPQPEYVKELFTSIASTYDKANDVMTFGMARDWRKRLVTLSGVKKGDKVLDCATGTGDLAIDFKKTVVTGEVIGSDFCEEMLKTAPEKARREGLDVKFEVADAMQLPYPSNHFDVTSIAYGIRNVQNPSVALSEMARVTKPGGAVMVLETGETKVPLLKTAIGIYFKYVVPRLGGWVSGNRAAYDYLNKSSQAFPSGEKFTNLMKSTQQFTKVECHSIMGGASFIYKGVVS